MRLPGKGEIVTMRDWSGSLVAVKVQHLGESKVYGPTVEGLEMEGLTAQRFTALPLDHLVVAVNIHRAGHGKWDVLFEEGEERVKSKKAALELVAERGYTLGQEV